MLLFVKQWWWEVLSCVSWRMVLGSWDRRIPMLSRWICVQLTNLFSSRLEHFKSYHISLLDFVCLHLCNAQVALSWKFSTLGTKHVGRKIRSVIPPTYPQWGGLSSTQAYVWRHPIDTVQRHASIPNVTLHPTWYSIIYIFLDFVVLNLKWGPHSAAHG